VRIDIRVAPPRDMKIGRNQEPVKVLSAIMAVKGEEVRLDDLRDGMGRRVIGLPAGVQVQLPAYASFGGSRLLLDDGLTVHDLGKLT
jgi:hypothetical protein